ncbi:hypothetical protein [Planctomyces sp. SH-PL14]|uniref:hypothetical protein n=1 Tax=Planctomyces sp. SH-PL14 TaxID=1632864 RepID=UPI00078C1CA2|nr:hypothetical protein [Planctomyces sp. SH-PL14]AMV16513.1 hypothetical protein VT03_01395 [Planctomyces sp. SH-PL14]
MIRIHEIDSRELKGTYVGKRIRTQSEQVVSFPTPVSALIFGSPYLELEYRSQDAETVRTFFETRLLGFAQPPRSLIQEWAYNGLTKFSGRLALGPVFRALVGQYLPSVPENRRIGWPEQLSDELERTFYGHVFQQAFDFIRTFDRGVIRGWRPRLLDQLIAQVITAYPERNIVVALANERSGVTLGVRVQELVPANLRKFFAFLKKGDSAPSERRYFFGGITHLQGVGDNPNRIDLILLGDARFCGHESVPETLDVYEHAKVFAFINEASPLSAYEDDFTRSVLGFEEMWILGPGENVRFPSIRKIKVPRGESLPSTLSELELLKRGIIHHRERNRLVVEVAEKESGSSQLIVAANLEHALLLAKKLPRWHIPEQYLQPRWAKVQYEKMPRVKRTMSQPPLHIVPCPDFRRVQLSLYRLIVYAAGTTEVPDHIQQGLLWRQLGRSSVVTWVDFSDRQHWRLRRDAARRFQEYASWGWAPEGQSVGELRIRQFIARRIANLVSH